MTFASGSRAQVRTLKGSLHALSRGDDSIVTYMDRAKRIFDQLGALDAAISEDDLVDHILRGLGSDYRPFVRNIEAKLQSISFDDLFATDDTLNPPAVAHYAGRQSSSATNRGRGRGNRRNGSYSGPNYSSSPHTNTKQWIVDTGASHHLTSELENLGIHSEYTGTDEVTLTNGKTLPISRVGSTTLSLSSRFFNLSNVLHVPEANLNLLSVPQFTLTNDVSVEFFHDSFVIKDRQTKQPLHRGVIQNGLYRLATDPVSPACHSVSLPTWHARLGYACSNTVNKVLSLNKLFAS
ncbi:hypothetical protein K2173_013781 [Erythroxylum novogranatense]|uniref:Retrovirus-related Pol polyprotein from transposon TNT 1-94-like beta-barrel domain-containing protein n=1 Tax=Erythroxylum novogranatense TaxID=1862640 RepID=A0AAV8SCX2_9ROSI|nr:hypothetical protein K2173_013781 [Erythroxylum novogranatense]